MGIVKKNIIIVSHNLGIGGIEKSLLGLLQSIDYNKCNVDLFLFRVEGSLLDFVPKDVNIFSQNKYYADVTLPFSENIKKLDFRVSIAKLLANISYKNYNKNNKDKINDVSVNYLYYFSNKFLPSIFEKEYDLAISFSDVHYCVKDKINAKSKIAWIHTDYKQVKQNKELCFNMWNAYDYIAAVSEECKNSFLYSYPELSDKIIVVENILSKAYIQSEADKFLPEEFDDSFVSLLSIGRFCTAKNFDNVPFICKRLLEKGLKVKWYLIGYGGDEQLIKEKIDEAGVQDNVIILGKKENPYPYIKACDLYVQPSRYEGKSVTVREAQMLSKPVVITNYATSSSQLEDGVDGIIVPVDNDSCADGIAEVLSNSELMQKLVENCNMRDYSNSQETEKLYKLIEE